MSRVASIWVVVFGALVLLSTSGGAMAQSVVINDVPLVTTRTPVTMGGSMLLPMRDVFEALQSEVKWFASEQKVMVLEGPVTHAQYVVDLDGRFADLESQMRRTWHEAVQIRIFRRRVPADTEKVVV